MAPLASQPPKLPSGSLSAPSRTNPEALGAVTGAKDAESSTPPRPAPLEVGLGIVQPEPCGVFRVEQPWYFGYR